MPEKTKLIHAVTPSSNRQATRCDTAGAAAEEASDALWRRPEPRVAFGRGGGVGSGCGALDGGPLARPVEFGFRPESADRLRGGAGIATAGEPWIKRDRQALGKSFFYYLKSSASGGKAGDTVAAGCRYSVDSEASWIDTCMPQSSPPSSYLASRLALCVCPGLSCFCGRLSCLYSTEVRTKVD